MPKTIEHEDFQLSRQPGGTYELTVKLIPVGMSPEEFIARVVCAVNSGFGSKQVCEHVCECRREVA